MIHGTLLFCGEQHDCLIDISKVSSDFMRQILKAASLFSFFFICFLGRSFLFCMHSSLLACWLILFDFFWVSQFDKSLFQRVQSMQLHVANAFRCQPYFSTSWSLYIFIPGIFAVLETRSLHWCQMRRRHTSWTFRKPAGSSLDLWIQPTDWLALCFKWTLVQFDAVAAGSMANLVYQTPCDLLCCSAAFSWNARRLKWTPLNFADTLSPLVSKWFKTWTKTM